MTSEFIFTFKIPLIMILIPSSMEIQGQKEVHELCVKLKETRQLHESAVYEVQTLKSEYKNLLEEKVWLALKTKWYWQIFSSIFEMILSGL